MPRRKVGTGSVHICELVRGSESCLPKLPPQSGKLKRCLRECRKIFMVTPENPSCRHFFRSNAAIQMEKKRHLRSSNWFIIHPFSKFCIFQERLMCILWMISFFKDPFRIAYYANTLDHLYTEGWLLFDLTIDMVMLLNIVMCFNKGTHNIQTKEVLLDPYAIALRYLKQYFFFDLFGTIPFHYVFDIYYGPHNEDVYLTLIDCLHFLRFVRITTMMSYLRRLTEFFIVRDSIHYVICLMLLTIYFLHWWSCMLFILPKIKYGFNGPLPKASWVIMAKIEPGRNVTVWHRYRECMLSAMCHFFRAGIVITFLAFSQIQLLNILFIHYL